MSTLPQTPTALLEELFIIFPEYRSNYGNYGPLHDGSASFHSVLMEFTPFFGTELVSLSEVQLRQFSELVNGAVAKGGPMGNAFETCLLEHLRQIQADIVLRPYLSQIAFEKLRP